VLILTLVLILTPVRVHRPEWIEQSRTLKVCVDLLKVNVDSLKALLLVQGSRGLASFSRLAAYGGLR
jgi:hypothetical protein